MTAPVLSDSVEIVVAEPVPTPPDSGPAPFSDIDRQLLGAIYGDSFPLARDDEPDESDWVAWVRWLWDQHEAASEEAIWYALRNRSMREGDQWIDSPGPGIAWTTPPKPKGMARVVANHIKPALDMRLQIRTEQRPGFKAKPSNRDPEKQKKARAFQGIAEWHWDEMKMARVMREAAYWADTDHQSYCMMYWDPDAGELDETGTPVGMPAVRVYRLEQVRVSANASNTERPYYWILQDTIPYSLAAARYGEAVLDGATISQAGSEGDVGSHQGESEVDIDSTLRDQQTVERSYVFLEPSELFPKGMMVLVVGDKLLYANEVPWGVVPIWRLRDGSTDPRWYGRAEMDEWVRHQRRINLSLSRWVDDIRKGRVTIAKRPGAVSTESMVGGLSMIEITGSAEDGPLGNSFVPITMASVSKDVKELLATDIRFFENLSGWNDTARGSVSSSVSGRAIIAIREQLERLFGPMIGDQAESTTEWARILFRFVRFFYDDSRLIGILGRTRSDLAGDLTFEDGDSIPDIQVDPETLMPMPRSLKQFLLDRHLEMGAINVQEWRRRQEFSFIDDLQTPDDDQHARARRVAHAIKRRLPIPPLLWQTNEAIEQDVLEREILLDDDQPEDVRAIASQRWADAALQAQLKTGGLPPEALAGGGGGGGGAPGGGGGAGPAFPPSTQPVLSGSGSASPSVASAPASVLTGEDTARLTRDFERANPR